MADKKFERPVDHYLIEQVAEAIYLTHWTRRAPTWDKTSPEVAQYVRDQAQSAIKVVDQYRSGTSAATRVPRRESS